MNEFEINLIFIKNKVREHKLKSIMNGDTYITNTLFDKIIELNICTDYKYKESIFFCEGELIILELRCLSYNYTELVIHVKNFFIFVSNNSFNKIYDISELPRDFNSIFGVRIDKTVLCNLLEN